MRIGVWVVALPVFWAMLLVVFQSSGSVAQPECDSRCPVPCVFGLCPSVDVTPNAPPLASVAPFGQAPNEARISFLLRGEAELPAKFYGYLVIGPGVSTDRKLAVLSGFACRLEVAVSADIEQIGLVLIPALQEAAGEVTSSAEMFAAYDFPRATRWLRAADSGDDAVLFIGSRLPRAQQLDAASPPALGDTSDLVIADASALSPRYLRRWTIDLIDGVRQGTIRSRQDLQFLMEAHSWLEIIGEPLAAVMQIGPKAASAALPADGCL